MTARWKERRRGHEQLIAAVTARAQSEPSRTTKREVAELGVTDTAAVVCADSLPVDHDAVARRQHLGV
jgi:hypothetical protein